MVIDSVALKSESGGKTKAGPTYERVYNVYFSSDYSCAALVNNTHASLPKVGNLHPLDSRAKVDSVAPALADGDGGDGSGLATYTVNYVPLTLGEAGEVHPLDRPVRVSGSGSNGLTEVFMTDINGDALLNSASDLYGEIPEIPVVGLSFTMTRNEAGNPLNKAAEYSNTTNIGTWYGVGEGNGLLGEITFSQTEEEFAGTVVTFWVVDYPFRLIRDDDGDGWNWKPIDNGYKYVVEDERNRTATDDVGNITVEPILLDGAGAELPTGDPPVVFPTGGYELIDPMSWSALGLPNPFTI